LDILDEFLAVANGKVSVHELVGINFVTECNDLGYIVFQIEIRLTVCVLTMLNPEKTDTA